MPKLYKMLETKNRKEQEERVEQLLAMAKSPVAVITIAIYQGQATFGIVGRPSPEVLIQALDVVRDDILMAMARQEAEQEVPKGDQCEGGPPEAKDYKDKEPEVLIQALDVVRDDILVAMARQEAEGGEGPPAKAATGEDINFKEQEEVGPQTGDVMENGDMTP